MGDLSLLRVRKGEEQRLVHMSWMMVSVVLRTPVQRGLGWSWFEWRSQIPASKRRGIIPEV